MAEISAFVARHGVQNADENWSKVTRDPSGLFSSLSDNRWPWLLPPLIRPELNRYQNPNPVAAKNAIEIGSNDFMRVVCPNGARPITHQLIRCKR